MQIGSSLLWSVTAAPWEVKPCVPLSVGSSWLSPAGGAGTVYSVPTDFSDFALPIWVQIYHLVTAVFLSALLAPALFSLSQMILVTSVTGHEKARLAVGEAGQDVMELDWEAGFGMCSCAAQLTCCHPIQGQEQGARLWDGITGAGFGALQLSTATRGGLLFIALNVHCKLPSKLDFKMPFQSPRSFLNRKEANKPLSPSVTSLSSALSGTDLQ